MASFTIAYTKFVQPWEGGYANNLTDKGGETYAGIARNYHPSWIGWQTIDKIKLSRAIKTNEIIQELTGPTTTFYANLWNNAGFDKIESQDVANLLFDYYVNSGSRAIKDVQNIVNVNADGVLGPVTLAAINAGDTTKINNALKTARTNLVTSIVARDPSQSVFLAGWLNRIGAFPTLAGVSIVVLLIAGIVVFLLLKK